MMIWASQKLVFIIGIIVGLLLAFFFLVAIAWAERIRWKREKQRKGLRN
jgi:uncharacterized membrane-anchored protein YhcB (DUF1043 family)